MTGDNALLLLVGTGTGAVVLILLSLLLGQGGNRTARRMDSLQRRWQPTTGAAAVTSLRLEGNSSSRLGRWVPKKEALRVRLARTGRDLSPGRYITISFACGAVGFAILHFVLGRPLGLSVVGGLAIGIGLPHLAIGSMINRRINRFLADFPDAIDLIVRGLRSGLPIQETVSTVAGELPDPVGPEFRRIESSLKVGQSLDEALWGAATRIAVPEFRFFVISLSVQRETGGNLAETLGNLADILRRRRQMKLKIRALSSEARASAYIIGSLPFVMCLILLLINPGYVMQLFTDPRGVMLVGVALSSIVLGAVVMARMIKFEI